MHAHCMCHNTKLNYQALLKVQTAWQIFITDNFQNTQIKRKINENNKKGAEIHENCGVKNAWGDLLMNNIIVHKCHENHSDLQ